MDLFFGIRHHGPGCARSLVAALRALQPDIVLVEGPPEADGLLGFIGQPVLVPPVALLTHAPEQPRRAVYHPFAEFSPEWQALRWAVAAGVPARFIDLPRAHDLALDEAEPEGEEGPAEDPLDGLARAAGHADAEAWWNQAVEERGEGAGLFEAIAEAITAVRAEAAAPPPARARREALREAHMRQCLRAARREGFQRIAVVVGAWHVPALRDEGATAKADQALLKGLPKLKVQCTWVPWTHRHLLRASGYGAGIRSPGWYEHLWRSGPDPAQRGAGWLARIARLMRERGLDCSSAHLIEGTRLAEALAALRGRSAPGLDELQESARAVFALGDETVLRFVDDALVVGDRLGEVPPEVPTVPLQQDLEAQQRSLRLKPEAVQKTLDLDLRQPNDLARSRLLHRLRLLGLPWGEIARIGRSARGSFHEVWTLQWQPEFALRLIEASRHGRTVAQAATACVRERCAGTVSLADLAALVDQALLADLDEAVAEATRALQDRAAASGDLPQLLAALPALANVQRYGNVRQTDAALVAAVLDGLILRAAIGLPLAAQALGDEAAETLHGQVLAAHAAVRLRGAEATDEAWRQALQRLAQGAPVHELLQGLAVRLLLDGGTLAPGEAATAMSLQLSAAAEPARAAAWLEGFLNRDAMVLLHDGTVWGLLDGWLAGLGEEHFLRVLPLLRRSFAAFGPGERRDLGQRARQAGAAAAPAAASGEPPWDEARATQMLPLLRRWWGIEA